MGVIDYKEVKDWGDGIAVRKAIVIRPRDCDRVHLVDLANHLSRRFVLNPAVVINIFNDETAALAYDKQLGDEEQKEFALAHWPARYVKSWPVGLNELVFYPNCDHHKPERVAY
ncbi:MAG: hypothetical protein M0T85_05070 [Dehalococcoidales bacterium]|nr:hypothetical protein [Dehalococcoidales bacterium]